MLAAPGKAGLMGGAGPTEGPVEYTNITLEDDRVVACVQSGLFLVHRAGEPLAVLVAGPAREFQPMAQVTIQVMAPDRDHAERILAAVRTAMRKRNVYRGHVLSLVDTRMGGTEIKFHRLGEVSWEKFVQRTEGASAAFIREMMRKAALFAADEPSTSVEDRHLDEAIHELVVEGGSLTQRLLGFGPANGA